MSSLPIKVKEHAHLGQIRCFCARGPLLGVYGIGTDRKPYISIKIWKQRRLFGHIVAKSGEVCIQCRDCYRWYTIFISDSQPYVLKEVPGPEVENDTGLVVAGDDSDV